MLQILSSKNGHAAGTRVREIGAFALSRLGFQRTTGEIIKWLDREPIEAVRRQLSHALERSCTASAADELLQRWKTPTRESRPWLAKAGSYAGDRSSATDALLSIASTSDDAGAEALVSLAKMGQRFPKLAECLVASNPYIRMNAALVRVFGDGSIIDRLKAIYQEASAHPLERVMIAASLAILRTPASVEMLHRDLVEAANQPEIQRRADTFFAHRFIQAAILDGLAAAGIGPDTLHDAWAVEFEPLGTLPIASDWCNGRKRRGIQLGNRAKHLLRISFAQGIHVI